MIGDTLKRLRNMKNITSEELCTQIGIKSGSYRNYERNDRKPDYETLIKLADFYDVTTDYLLGKPDAKPPADPVEEFVDKVQMKEQEQIILKKWLALDEKQRRVVFDFMVDIVHEYESASVQSNAQSQSEIYISKTAARNGEPPGEKIITQEELDEIRSRPDADPDM